MTETAERVELGVDLTSEVTCGWLEQGGTCSRQAAWVLRHNVCCNYTKQYCEGHKQEMITRLSSSPGVRCSRNRKMKNPPLPTWREL